MSAVNVVARSLRKSSLTLTTCLLALAGIKPAAAQLVSSSQSQPTPTPQVVRDTSDAAPTTEISFGTFGQLTPTRNPTSVTTASSQLGSFTHIFQQTQGTSPSAGATGTFHQQFRRFLGYNVNLGYSRFAENYSVAEGYTGTVYNPTSSLQRTSIGTNMYELGLTSVLEGPRTRRFSTYTETGGAVLTFLPTARPSTTAQQFRPALAFGMGINYKVADHLSMRVAYRGLFYKNPDFRDPGHIPDDIKLFTVTSQPTVSLVYTFGHHRKIHAFTY